MALCCTLTSKITIVVVAVLFWVVSGALIFLSAWILTEYAKFGHVADIANSSLLPAYVLLCVGIVLFVLGLIGCIGAMAEQKCLMGLYFSLLLLALVGLAAGVGLAYMYRGIIDRDLHDLLLKGLDKYNNDSVIRTAIDDMQRELHCCGVDNYADWNKTASHVYPSSCCKNNTCYYTEHDQNVYTQGCYAEMRTAFIRHITAIYAVVATCAFLLLIGMVSACFLIHTRQPVGFIYRDLSDTDGMRV